MANPAGVRRDFDALEKRRFQAIRLFKQAQNQSEIAHQVIVVRQTVARWVQQYCGQGRRAVQKAGRAGRKAGLRPEDLRRIEKGLKRGPEIKTKPKTKGGRLSSSTKAD